MFLEHLGTEQVGLYDVPLIFPAATGSPPPPTPACNDNAEVAPPALPYTPCPGTGLCFIPATPPQTVAASQHGVTSCDWDEAARQGVKVAELKFWESGPKKKKVKTLRSLGIKERDSRHLGIIGWAALNQFQKVPATPLQLWIRTDRYPELKVEGNIAPPVFTRAAPILKALLPVRIPGALPHALSYIECGYSPPGRPLDRCRVLLPTISDWESHQFLTHAKGFLCPSCRIWLATEGALKAHSLECNHLQQQ